MTPEEVFIDSLPRDFDDWTTNEMIYYLGLPKKYQDECCGNDAEENRKRIFEKLSNESDDTEKILYRFTDGIYDARHINPDGSLTWKFYNYDSILPSVQETRGKNASSDSVRGSMPMNIFQSKCQKEFDMDFPLKNAWWRDIKTPIFDKIVKHQFSMFKESDEMYDFLCAMIGRCLGPISDNYRITPSLMGNGLGKSTIINMISCLFEQDDIGYFGYISPDNLGNLDILKDNKIVIGQDISTWKTTMNLLCKQETVNIPSGSFNTEYFNEFNWNIPMFLSGRKSFEKDLNKKNLIQFPFLRNVDNCEINLLEEMKKNLPLLLHKFNSAYLEVFNKSRNDLSKIAPKYIISSIV